MEDLVLDGGAGAGGGAEEGGGDVDAVGADAEGGC